MRIFKEKGRIKKQREAAKSGSGEEFLRVEDYRQYHLSKKESFFCLAAYVGLDALVSYLFYRSWIAFFLFFPFAVLFFKEYKSRLGKQRREILEKEFLIGMQTVSTALSAGYSIENAIKEARRELRKSMGMNAIIMREFSQIAVGIEINRTVEELFWDLALRSGVEDIESFAQVFTAAKRSGGDLILIIRNTVQSICQKEEIRQEIMVCLAEKRMEQGVMCLMPFFILLYVELTSPGFLDVLYHNWTGVSVMTGCLVLYIFSWWIGRRIVKIEV